MPDRHLDRVDELVDAGTFPNRSEAIRELVRRGALAHELADREGLETYLESDGDDATA
jgi:Arc/MetJ-type ribon-helix-helix transcriptional regulator